MSFEYGFVKKILAVESKKFDKIEEFKRVLYEEFLDLSYRIGVSNSEQFSKLQYIGEELELLYKFPIKFVNRIITLAGGFSSGKSSFMNSLLMDKSVKLPSDLTPVTAIPTYVINSENIEIKGFSFEKGFFDITPEEFKSLGYHKMINEEESFEFNLKDIVPYIIFKAPFMDYKNICFVDTPGYNSASVGYTSEDEETAKTYIKEASAVLWFIKVDTAGTISNTDIEFLQSILEDGKKVYIVINGADLRSEEELEQISNSVEDNLSLYSIDYEGISVYSSIECREYFYKKKSLFQFLKEQDKKVDLIRRLIKDINQVFDYYKSHIDKMNKDYEILSSYTKTIELDFMEVLGIDNKKEETVGKIGYIRKYVQEKLKDVETLNNELEAIKTKMLKIVSDIIEESRVKEETGIINNVKDALEKGAVYETDETYIELSGEVPILRDAEILGENKDNQTIKFASAKLVAKNNGLKISNITISPQSLTIEGEGMIEIADSDIKEGEIIINDFNGDIVFTRCNISCNIKSHNSKVKVLDSNIFNTQSLEFENNTIHIGNSNLHSNECGLMIRNSDFSINQCEIYENGSQKDSCYQIKIENSKGIVEDSKIYNGVNSGGVSSDKSDIYIKNCIISKHSNIAINIENSAFSIENCDIYQNGDENNSNPQLWIISSQGSISNTKIHDGVKGPGITSLFSEAYLEKVSIYNNISELDNIDSKIELKDCNFN